MRAGFGAAATSAAPIAVVALGVDQPDRWAAPQEREAARAALRELLAGWPGNAGWFVQQREEVLWAFLPGVAVRDCLPLARAITRAVREVRFEVGGRARRLSVRAAVVHSHHRSQPTLETCLAVAREGLRTAGAGGVCLALHSTLYGGPGEPGRSWPPAGSAAATPEVELHEVELAPVPPPEVAAPAGAGRELDEELLQRRLRKVTAELQHAEAELAHLRGERAEEAHALPSGHRETEGLSPDEAHADRKRELLERIYRANTELRRLQQRP